MIVTYLIATVTSDSVLSIGMLFKYNKLVGVINKNHNDILLTKLLIK